MKKIAKWDRKRALPSSNRFFLPAHSLAGQASECERAFRGLEPAPVTKELTGRVVQSRRPDQPARGGTPATSTVGRKTFSALLKILASLLWFFSLAVPLKAQDGSSGVSSFFLLGAGARAVGMGGSFVSVADDASAVFWNPAGLGRLSFAELSFTHVTLPEGSEFDFAAATYPTVKAGAFSAGFLRVGTDGIFSRDGRATETGELSFSETEFLAGYGYRLFRFLSVGANGKLSSQSLAGFSGSAFGADVGFLVAARNFSLGLNVQDVLSSDLTLKNSKEEIRRNLKTGASYFLPLAGGNWGVRAAFDVDKTAQSPAALHAGGEISYLGYLFLRGGYDRRAATFGAGLAYRRVGLDYAFKASPEAFSASHRFGFSFRFGASVTERARAALEKKEKARRQEFKQLNRMRLEDYRLRAGEFSASGLKDSALAYLRLALGIDPDDVELQKEARRLADELETERKKGEAEALAARLRQDALSSARREYEAGNFKEALAVLEKGRGAGDEAFVELGQKISGGLDSAKKALDAEGWRAFRQRDFDGALSAWEKLSGLDPSDSLAKSRFQMVAFEIETDDWLKEGIAAFDARRLLAAGESFRRVLQRRPQDPAALGYLQKIQAATGQKTTLEDLQKDPEAWRQYNEGLAAYTAREYQKALELWQKLLERYPNNEALLRNVADAKKRME